MKIIEETLQRYLNEQDMEVKNPGLLEVPEGKGVHKMSLSHFQSLIRKQGWNKISKGLVNLITWNKNTNPKLSQWADKMQEKLSQWVASQRKLNPKFGS